MKHQRFKLIIFCSNDNPVLILTYFTARSNFETSAFIWGKCDNDGNFRNNCILSSIGSHPGYRVWVPEWHSGYLEVHFF